MTITKGFLSKSGVIHVQRLISGIHQSLYPQYYSDFEVFLDSAENLDFSRYAIRLPESMMYRVNAFKGLNRIELYVNNENTTLNVEVISKDKLEQVIYKFIKNIHLTTQSFLMWMIRLRMAGISNTWT